MSQSHWRAKLLKRADDLNGSKARIRAQLVHRHWKTWLSGITVSAFGTNVTVVPSGIHRREVSEQNTVRAAENTDHGWLLDRESRSRQ
jgi:hypothetical protein